MRKSLLSLLALTVAVAPILVGCSGGDDSADTGAPTTPAKTTADPNKPASSENAAGAKPVTPL